MKSLIPIVLLCVAASAAWADSWVVGTTLEGFGMADQHDNPKSIGPSVRSILFSRDMDGGKILRAAVGDREEGAARLERAGAVYVADVSGMPGVIRSLFAMPSLRRRGYPILVDLDGTQTADFPSAEAQGTLIELTDLRITTIAHFESAEELRARLDALAPEDSEEVPPLP